MTKREPSRYNRRILAHHMGSIDTLIIGSKYSGHDSSVFFVMPHEKRLAAIQTERVTRFKHDRTFAEPALRRLLAREEIDCKSVKHVVFCNSFKVHKEWRLPENRGTLDLLLRAHLKTPYEKDALAAQKRFSEKPRTIRFFDLLRTTPGRRILWEKFLLLCHVRKVLSVDEIERRFLRSLFPNAEIEVKYYDHEYCHAACAAVTAPFDSGLVITFDGWGDEHFSHVYTLSDGTLVSVTKSPRTFVPQELKIFEAFLPSVGGIYMYFTRHLGFVPEEDEGKVEALAAYGAPIPDLLEKLMALVSIADDLSMHIDAQGFAEEFNPEKFSKLTVTYSKEDLSATVQTFLEKVTLSYFPRLLKATGMKNLALAGGIAANVINNLSIYEHITPNLHITPAMADDGSAQGAAYAHLLERGEDVSWIKELEMPYYATSYSREEVQKTLDQISGINVRDLKDAWPEETAELVAKDKIGAIFHGRMEWGPRALGHRSIIAGARRKDFRDIINRNIKRRPLFQPFCPSILAEEKDRLFASVYLNKHMTCAFRLKEEFCDLLPSATHIDGTARVQFVEKNDDPHYWRLLKKVKELTGFGVIINTSFNKHGRTIVETPEDALRDFLDTDMDYLVIEGFLVTRAL